MISILYFFIILIVLVIIFSLAWRCGSRQHSLPCPVWMKWLLDPPFPGGVSPRTRRTIERLDLQPGMNVLDAGCGPGRLSIPIAKIAGSGGTVTAMDIQDGMLQEVRNRADKDNITNIRFIQGGIGEGTLESAHYDRTVLITVLGEIPNMKAAIQEIFQALKPGGILLIEETIRDPHFQTRST
ncbi:MAG: methyltransferase type 11, partial [Methanomicrobiales archaeon HGW-Methanomicrobiales-4]